MLQNKLHVFCCPFFRTFRVEAKPVNNASSLLLSAVRANERERFSADNSGEISLNNAVAVNEILSQDIENELYMMQSGNACSISPQIFYKIVSAWYLPWSQIIHAFHNHIIFLARLWVENI